MIALWCCIILQQMLVISFVYVMIVEYIIVVIFRFEWAMLTKASAAITLLNWASSTATERPSSHLKKKIYSEISRPGTTGYSQRMTFPSSISWKSGRRRSDRKDSAWRSGGARKRRMTCLIKDKQRLASTPTNRSLFWLNESESGTKTGLESCRNRRREKCREWEWSYRASIRQGRASSTGRARKKSLKRSTISSSSWITVIDCIVII